MSPSASTDVLIIGGGLAGARAALASAKAGAKTVLASKTKVGKGGASARASGGFAAALGEDDTPAQHAADTLKGGCGVNRPEQVDLITQNAGNALLSLNEELSLKFSSNAPLKGNPAPLHSHARSVQYPLGMNRMMEQLRDQLLSVGVELWENHRAVELLVGTDGEVSGACIFDDRRADLVICQAGSIVLATGGCGQLYPVTSNGPESTGDGYALALRAGFTLQDMEFLQFTPTAFAAPVGLRGHTIVGTLLTLEGVRLLNSDDEPFMQRYAPDKGEAADRATLARAIFREVREGRGSPAGGVFLDATSVSPDFFNAHRPGFYDLCRTHGVDPCTQFLETAPSMHTCLGGIKVDGELKVARNMFAAGEVLAGSHGANRLSSNSLTEANVTGEIAGHRAAKIALAQKSACKLLDEHTTALPRSGAGEVGDLLAHLKMTMEKAAGVERNAAELRVGMVALKAIRGEFESAGQTGVTDLGAWLDLRNMLDVAHVVLGSALKREESRGAHFRTDYPASNDAEWLGNVTATHSDETLSFAFQKIE